MGDLKVVYVRKETKQELLGEKRVDEEMDQTIMRLVKEAKASRSK